MGISEFTQKVIGDKREWREYKARVRALPEPYRVAVDGIERYLFHFGAVEADTSIAIFADVADIFERAAADGTPIRVSHVAQVGLGEELRSGAATENGREVVLGTVFMLIGEDSRAVAQAVAANLVEINRNLPKGVVAGTV